MIPADDARRYAGECDAWAAYFTQIGNAASARDMAKIAADWRDLAAEIEGSTP